VEKISEISAVHIARYQDKIPFLALQKTGHLHFTSSHLYEKMSKMAVILWINSSRQVGYILENFQIIGNCTTYRKKIVSRNK